MKNFPYSHLYLQLKNIQSSIFANLLMEKAGN